MVVKVKMSDVVDALELNSDESRSFLNMKTGEVVTLTTEDIAMASLGGNIDDMPKWQRYFIQIARDIENNVDTYVELPGKYEINEYGIMERFCYSLPESISDKLCALITGKGAFRRFKDSLERYRLEDRWKAYHENALKELALSWIKDHNLEIEK